MAAATWKVRIEGREIVYENMTTCRMRRMVTAEVKLLGSGKDVIVDVERKFGDRFVPMTRMRVVANGRITAA